jgi:cytochrome c553
MRLSAWWLVLLAMAAEPQALAEREAPTHIAACQACHERDEPDANGLIPILAGQRREYLVLERAPAPHGSRGACLARVIR